MEWRRRKKKKEIYIYIYILPRSTRRISFILTADDSNDDDKLAAFAFAAFAGAFRPAPEVAVDDGIFCFVLFVWFGEQEEEEEEEKWGEGMENDGEFLFFVFVFFFGR